MKHSLATVHLLLISPAILFLIAVIVQGMLPLQAEPAHTAHQIVMGYAARMWTLWVLLLALPISVFISGCISLLQGSSSSTQVAGTAQKTVAPLPLAGEKTSVAVTTVTAAVIVGIVVLHMLAN